MSWTVADVGRFKKGLSDAEKKRWVAIANDTLKTCVADGGEQQDCEGRAVRIANAKCKVNTVLTFVQNRTGEVRTETLGGIQYLVAPVVSIVEGVLNGELLLAEEFGAFPSAWDGRPVVLGHPCDADGLPISANNPETLEQCMVGTVYNTTSNGKLKHEMWIEVRRAERTADGKELLRRLRGNNPVEVSTAYFRDVDEESGEYNGIAYEGVARNIRPDHLASLLHEEGACSWRDGCGAPRLNEQSKGDEIRVIRDAWYEEHGTQKVDHEGWVTEVFDDHVIVEQGGKYWQVPYTQSDAEIVFAEQAQWQRVEERREWVPAALRAFGKVVSEIREFITHERRNKMNQKVQRILAVEAGFTQEGLEGMSECALDAIVGLLPAENEQDVGQDVGANQDQDDDEPEVPSFGDLLEEALADLGGMDGLKRSLAELRANEDKERADLIGPLVANEQCRLSQDQLSEMGTETLRALSLTFRPVNYGGQGGEPVVNVDEFEPYPIPAVYEKGE